ncbi:hypothetical protein SG34_004905 [Thalassomonas viridans]|uniref:Uncharacterized protein n=1 Tax=Thalassomonas viridans TaxID=137584 RepID=A0AAF0C8C0_9GAMM|nr:hypothetical protein [Thalassomonas viridans]WDE06267.1 hypothetical protein SG34_004905 [Thalassomonas viridans]
MKAIHYVTLVVILLVTGAMAWVNNDKDAPIPILILAFGALGATVREHVEMRGLSPEERTRRLADAAIIVCFKPVVGALLALILMSLLLSGMISGDLFPKFVNIEAAFQSGKAVLRGGVTLAENGDFYKMIAWSIIAGYSERFVLTKLDSLTGKKKTSSTN